VPRRFRVTPLDDREPIVREASKSLFDRLSGNVP
jgi:hypothetical protein